MFLIDFIPGEINIRLIKFIPFSNNRTNNFITRKGLRRLSLFINSNLCKQRSTNILKSNSKKYKQN